MAIERKTRYYGSSNAKVHIFKFNHVSEKLTPRLIVASGERKTLSQLANLNPIGTETVLAINGGFFKNTLLASDILPLKNTYVNGVAKNKDGHSNFDQIADIFYTPTYAPTLKIQDSGAEEATAASWLRSGGYNLVIDAVKATKGISASQYEEKDKKTMIGVNGDEVIVAVAEAPGLTGSEMADLMLEEGAIHAIGLDGGGSTGCIYNGSSVMSSSRLITDAIIFTKKTGSSGGDSETGLYIKTDVLALRIRENPVNGTVLTTVPVGNMIKIRFFIDGFQSDGYQWAATEYNGIKGYSQIDTKNCYTVLGNNPKLKLSTQAHGGYVRSAVVDGSVNVEVPRGQHIEILELLPGFKSDGYQWARTRYNGISGYSQIDTKNWHFFRIF